MHFACACSGGATTADVAPFRWWQTRRFAPAAMLLAALPLLWPDVPPLTDLPGHVGRYRTMLDGGTGPLGQWYAFRWALVGNLGVDVLVRLLAPAIGLEPAVKAIVLAIPALTVAGCLWLSHEVHGRVSPFALFALPLAWHSGLHTGFLNFSLAMALCLLSAALWVRLGPTRARAPLFVPLSLLLWGTHVYGWAVLGILAFGHERARTRSLWRAALACLPLAAPLPLMLAWRAGSGGATFGFLDIEAKLIALLMSLRDRWFAWDAISLAVIVGAIWFGARSRRVQADPGLHDGALLLIVAFLVLPSWLFGSAFADARLAPFVLMIALLALRPIALDSTPPPNSVRAEPVEAPSFLIPRSKKNGTSTGSVRTGWGQSAPTIAAIALAFLLLRTAGTTASLALYDRSYDRELAALAHLPTGARVAALVSPTCDDRWRTARLDHLGGLAIARRRAFSNDQWPVEGAQLLTIRHPVAGRFASNPSQLLRCPAEDPGGLDRAIREIPRTAFDHVWLIGLPTVPPPIPGTTRIWATGTSALYRINRTDGMLTAPR